MDPSAAETSTPRRARGTDRYLRGLAALEHGGTASDAPPVARHEAPASPPAPSIVADDAQAVAAQRADRRRQARMLRRAPLAGLVLPATMGFMAVVVLRGDASASRGIAGFALAVLAAPALLAAGVPMRTGTAPMLAAVTASAALWALCGVWAARRAARRMAPTRWRHWWGEYATLALGIWVGAAVALVATQVMLTGRLL